MRDRLAAALCLTLALACGGPEDASLDTPIPRDAGDWWSIAPAVARIPPEKKPLFFRYVSRREFEAALLARPGEPAVPSVPAGMTIRKAIALEGRIDRTPWFVPGMATYREDTEARIEERRKAVQGAMRRAVAVELVSVRQATPARAQVAFALRNESSRDVSGVRGDVRVQDVFGRDVSSFRIESGAIEAGRTVEELCAKDNLPAGFASSDVGKLKVIWEPETIVFGDGATFDARIRKPHWYDRSPWSASESDDQRRIEETWFGKSTRPIAVTLASMELVAEPARNSDDLRLVFICKNNSSKDISGFRGTADVCGRFGENIHSFDIASDRTIKAGGSAEWTGALRGYPSGVPPGYRRDDSGFDTRALASRGKDALRVNWHPAEVVFTDGSAE